jgi:hypothetical protein
MKKLIMAVALASIAVTAHAENGILPMAAKPEDVGLSSAQLKRLEEVTQQHIDEGLVRAPSCRSRGAARFSCPGSAR